jgi:hypothetical protein
MVVNFGLFAIRWSSILARNLGRAKCLALFKAISKGFSNSFVLTAKRGGDPERTKKRLAFATRWVCLV